MPENNEHVNPRTSEDIEPEGESTTVECNYCGEEIEREDARIIDGYPYCSDCVVTCNDCGERLARETANGPYNRLYLCDDCNDNYSTCGRCDERVHDDDVCEVSGYSWCEECANNHSFRCTRCERRHEASVESRETADGDIICSSCYSLFFFTCRNCNQVYHDDDGSYDSRNVLRCAQCHDDHSEEEEDDEEYDASYSGTGRVHEYNYRPRPKFHGAASSMMYGVELEVHHPNNLVSLTYHLLSGYDHIYCKSDSSIDRYGELPKGYEIVTHPHTLDEHRKLWKPFFDDVPSNMVSHKYGSCGMHVHIGRNRLSPLQIGKMVYFVNADKNRRFIETIAQRGYNQYNKIEEKPITHKVEIEDHGSLRYESINLTNRHTVEVRIFRGTTRGDRFFKNLEFVDAMVRWTSEVSYRDLTAGKFVEWVYAHRHEYKYLWNYLVETNYAQPVLMDAVRKEILAQCA